MLYLGVVHPMSSGIGGGAFIIIRDVATEPAAESFDCRQTAPAAASKRCPLNGSIRRDNRPPHSQVSIWETFLEVPYSTIYKACKSWLWLNHSWRSTLEAISIEGPQALYNGNVGQKFIEDVRTAGGIVTMEDMRGYNIRLRSSRQWRPMLWATKYSACAQHQAELLEWPWQINLELSTVHLSMPLLLSYLHLLCH